MKLVYVAHPYKGSIDNAENAKKSIEALYQMHPNMTFVSPIHGLCCPYDSVAYYVGLSYCLELLNRCDYLLMIGNYENSTGCQAEMAFARKMNIPIKTLEDLMEEDWEQCKS